MQISKRGKYLTDWRGLFLVTSFVKTSANNQVKQKTLFGREQRESDIVSKKINLVFKEVSRTHTQCPIKIFKASKATIHQLSPTYILIITYVLTFLNLLWE